MRKNSIDKQLSQALQDATQADLPIHLAKLVQARIVALTKLFEHTQTTAKLTAEIARLTAELDHVKAENERLRLGTSQKPIEAVERIKRTLESAEAMRRTKQ